jgi:hypothetical protein
MQTMRLATARSFSKDSAPIDPMDIRCLRVGEAGSETSTSSRRIEDSIRALAR